MPNQSINKNILNDQILNGLAISQFSTIGSGNLVQIEQTVAKIESGNLLTIEQDIELQETGSGNLVLIEQVLENTGSGTLVTFEQHIFEDTSEPSTWFTRNGWDAIIRIGSRQIPTSEIHGPIVIEEKESSSSLAEFTLIPPSGVQDTQNASGQAVTIDANTSSGIRRIFTGLVDIPDIDIINKKVTYRCSNRRLEKINSSLSAFVNGIGSYSSEVFRDNDENTATKLENRLSTTPKTVDFDSYGNHYVVDLLAKNSPDYTLTDSDVYRRTPKIEFLSRARIVNSVNVSFKYRYQRQYHWKRNFSWTSPIANNFCLFLQDGYQLTAKAMVTQAALSAGWPIDGTISFTDPPNPGWYCGGQIAWIGSPAHGTYTQVTDENGNTVSDSTGNPVVTFERSQGTMVDFPSLFCTAATWSAGTRWSQVVEEDYNLTIQAPQSTAQYGIISGFVGTEFESPNNTDEWENYRSFDNQELGDNFRIDLDTDRSKFFQIQNVLINQAKTRIIKSHRDTRIQFFRSLWPELELYHTVRLNTASITATGKVSTIKHVLNASTGEAETQVTLSLSQALGSTSTTVPTFIAKPTDVAFSPETSTISLGSRYGEDPKDSNSSDTWNGFIGNITSGFQRTFFPAQFIVDTPPVPSEYRELRTITTSSGTFNVEIQNDEFEVTF